MRLHIFDFEGELSDACQQALALEAQTSLGEIDPEMFQDGWPDAFLAILGAKPEPVLQQLRLLYQQSSSLLSRVQVAVASPLSGEITAKLRTYRTGGWVPLPRTAEEASNLVAQIASAAQTENDDTGIGSDVLSRVHVFSHDFISQFPLAAVFVSLQKRVVWCNAQATRILGENAQEVVELLGKPYREALPNGIANALDEYWRILTAPDCIEPLVMSTPFHRRLLHATIAPISHEGALTGMGVLLTDQSFENDLVGLRGLLLRQLAEEILRQVDGLAEGLRLAKESSSTTLESTVRILNRLFPIVQKVERISGELLSVTQEMSERGHSKRVFDLAEVLGDILDGFQEIITRKNLVVSREGLHK